MTVGQSPYRMFSVHVRRVRRLSPSFTRLTFTGDDLDQFEDNGFDQRLKLIVPLPDHGLAHLPSGPDWYSTWRRLPDDLRNPIRTYTVRNVRPAQREVDADMVLHTSADGGVSGPAAQFALNARPGDRAALYGPDARHLGRHGGLEFRPPTPQPHLLLAADETGVPAVANIVRALPPDSVGHVMLEVPHPDDRFDLHAPPGVDVSWSARRGAGHGSHLLRMVLTAHLPPSRAQVPLAPWSAQRPDAPISQDAAAATDDELLWDVPTGGRLMGTPLYAWVAGEASTVRAIRRHLVTELGHDRSAVAFMGYWRMGRSEC